MSKEKKIRIKQAIYSMEMVGKYAKDAVHNLRMAEDPGYFARRERQRKERLILKHKEDQYGGS